jgi:hypothetical protein
MLHDTNFSGDFVKTIEIKKLNWIDEIEIISNTINWR